MICACAIIGGCASANNRYEQLNVHLANDIDCDTARAQISELEENKVSSSERFANGVATVLPTSIVLNLITGEYANRAKIASGHYDGEVQSRIDLIKQACMLDQTTLTTDAVT